MKTSPGRRPAHSPVTLAQARDYLTRGAQAIVKAGAPAPTLWRPPFDDVNPAYNKVAASLNERVVMSYGLPGTGIIDSQDWKGKLPGRRSPPTSSTASSDESGDQIPGLDSGTQRTYVVGYHDGLDAKVSGPAAASLQPIVKYMNQHDMCGTTNVPNPADGGVLGGAG